MDTHTQTHIHTPPHTRAQGENTGLEVQDIAPKDELTQRSYRWRSTALCSAQPVCVCVCVCLALQEEKNKAREAEEAAAKEKQQQQQQTSSDSKDKKKGGQAHVERKVGARAGVVIGT